MRFLFRIKSIHKKLKSLRIKRKAMKREMLGATQKAEDNKNTANYIKHNNR